MTWRTRLASLDGAFGLRRRAREQAFTVFVVAAGGGLGDVLTLVERVGGGGFRPEERGALARRGYICGRLSLGRWPFRELMLTGSGLMWANHT